MFSIRPLSDKDKPFVTQALKNLWGSEEIVYSGEVFEAASLPGFVAEERKDSESRSQKEGRVVGLITYVISNEVRDLPVSEQEISRQARNDNYCQIISINALTPGKGIGTALINAVKEKAQQQGCQKLTVITTNDNISGLDFYKKRGFVVKEVRKGAVAKSRAIKPQIPLTGENGIPLEDEIELEMKI